ncbi:MAG: phytoene/squalene synthase family protein [Bacteroidetes bacterium]|nr:MAG: phytoene/squalene synthase family protein [Bacteroidota bacterium]
MDFYTLNAIKISKTTTHNYSTSFSMGVWMLNTRYRQAIYAIYGFVRFADEIVDTFHDQDQKTLLKNFSDETYEAIEKGFSTNPILHSFQWAVNKYKIEHEHIDAFLYSMELDLYKDRYNREEYHRYIYGSAEVIGLMCLRVFYDDDDESYEKLKHPARKLGEAFQKVNFLRDMLSDYHERGRVYFPEVDFDNFNEQMKKDIEEEIRLDFKEAYAGIKELRKDIRLGVYLAYKYYLKLLEKIAKAQPDNLLEKRFRISNRRKFLLLGRCYIQNSLNTV